MNSDAGSRKQVSQEQIETLYVFFSKHPDLAKGKNKHSGIQMQLWEQCAKLLNAVPNSSIRDGRGWSKWWSDWKYRIRRRSLEIRTASDSSMQLPEGTCPLTPLEDKMLNLIGYNTADGEIIIDPLADGDTQDNEIHEKPKSRKRHKRECSPEQESDYFAQLCDENDDGGPSSPPETKPRLASASIDFPSGEPEASAFLKLEEEKLRTTNRIADSLENLTSEVSRMTQSLNQIVNLLSSFNGHTLHPG